MTSATLSFYGTSIGKKAVMAATGFLLFGYVALHLLGNLQVYAGPAKLNAYAAFLKGTPALLWGARGIMLVAILLHIWTGLLLTLQNWRSRPQPYACVAPQESSLFSRTMFWTGLALACFIVYHLLHLTLGTIHPHFDEANVFDNVVLGFSQWPAATTYVMAVGFLGLHLGHGVFSMFQSAGLSHAKVDAWRRVFSTGMTVLVVIGNTSMPLAVLLTHHLTR
jgi:succinate dehydrogenase / fumarate reductase cytochrome b subunit